MAIVSIVGRPNVGKSSLFNRIVGGRRAIVDNMPGVTRDRLFAEITWNDKEFYLVDTGGLLVKDEDPIMQGMKTQILQAINESDLVLFTIDGREGPTWMDDDVAEVLRKTSSKVLLVVNKVDDTKLEDEIYDAYKLGFNEVFGVSAMHDRGIEELMDRVVQLLPKDEGVKIIDETVIKVALVGRPNVGKSSLLNALSGENRSLVSDIPGTTRDSIDWTIEREGQRFQIIDTAGLRRKSKVKDDIEYYSSVRTMQSIDKCDVALMMMDATELATDQDKKLAAAIIDRGKGIIFVVNKWDLLPSNNPKLGDEITEKVRDEIVFAKWAPVVFGSALTHRGLGKILDAVVKVNANRNTRFSTTILNSIIRDMLAFERLPGDGKGRVLRIYYCTQVAIAPPTFVFFVNDHTMVTQAFENHLSKKIRQMGDYSGVPLRFIWRTSTKKTSAS